MSIDITPCADADQLRAYIDAHWRSGHVLAVDESMFAFTYMTPWVDRDAFPAGVSVLTAMDGSRLVGFLGAICTPYPRERSYWLALWHVLPELKGSGVGGRLLAEMQRIALSDNGRGRAGTAGWIGTFGAGPEALPVYLKRGYAVRAGRRWIFDPDARDVDPGPATPPAQGETPPDDAWLEHRYDSHPVYTYERRGEHVFRTEDNDWGRVTHAVRLGHDPFEAARAVALREREQAESCNRNYIMDAWAFERPGPGWSLAPEDLPSVFHPPEARGSTTYAVGYPFLPCRIHKGDCDQDRPNAVAADAAHSAA